MGSLTINEIREYLEKSAKAKDEDTDGKEQRKLLEEIFDKYDTNKDGSITKDEFCKGYIEKYTKLQKERTQLQEDK